MLAAFLESDRGFMRRQAKSREQRSSNPAH